MSEPNFTHPRFDPTYNFGHVLTTGSIAIMLLGLVWWQSNFQAKTEIQLEVNAKARNDYIPIIHEIVRIQAVTNSQLSSLANSSGALTDTNREQDAALANIRERLAAIEARMKLSAGGGVLK